MTVDTCAPLPAAPAEPTVAARIAAGLQDPGYVVVDGWLPEALVGDLAHTCRSLAVHGHLDVAGIGQGPLRVEDARYRRTDIRWIEPPLTGAESAWLDRCESLRVGLNERLLLGLFDFESHYSVYPVGGFYRRHVDRFVTDDRRTVSCVLYLNDEWGPGDGGALRIFDNGDTRSPVLDVLPERGRLVAFLSDRFPHEVLPTRRERFAIAGWFRRRPLGAPLV